MDLLLLDVAHESGRVCKGEHWPVDGKPSTREQERGGESWGVVRRILRRTAETLGVSIAISRSMSEGNEDAMGCLSKEEIRGSILLKQPERELKEYPLSGGSVPRCVETGDGIVSYVSLWPFATR